MATEEVNLCIACGDPAPMTWFCSCCTEVKEVAYKESARLGENFFDVIIRRDEMLRKHVEEVHKRT